MSGEEIINDMIYLVVDDGEDTNIFLTDQQEDGVCVFGKLSDAKCEAIESMQHQIRGLRMAIKKIRSLKRDDLEID